MPYKVKGVSHKYGPWSRESAVFRIKTYRLGSCDGETGFRTRLDPRRPRKEGGTP